MNAVAAQTSGENNPVAELMNNGSHQQAASMAYSLCSELNVPTEMVSLVGKWGTISDKL